MASKEEIEQIVNSAHRDPFEVLGAHAIKSGNKECVAVRALSPKPPRSSSSACDRASCAP